MRPVVYVAIDAEWHDQAADTLNPPLLELGWCVGTLDGARPALPRAPADLALYRNNNANFTDPLPLDLPNIAPSSAVDQLSTTIADLEAKMAGDTADAARAGRQFETVQRFRHAKSVVGTLRQVYMKGIPVPQINMELAVPLDRFDDAVAALQRWLATTRHTMHYPFIFRCTGGSDAWLTPHRGQPLCWIGCLVYLAKDGSAKPGSFEMMREIQEVLVPLGATPHFGKHLVMDLYDWPRLFPKLVDFKRLMVEWDPAGKFQNEWTQDLFSRVAPLGDTAPACIKAKL